MKLLKTKKTLLASIEELKEAKFRLDDLINLRLEQPLHLFDFLEEERDFCDSTFFIAGNEDYNGFGSLRCQRPKDHKEEIHSCKNPFYRLSIGYYEVFHKPFIYWQHKFDNKQKMISSFNCSEDSEVFIFELKDTHCLNRFLPFINTPLYTYFGGSNYLYCLSQKDHSGSCQQQTWPFLLQCKVKSLIERNIASIISEIIKNSRSYIF